MTDLALTVRGRHYAGWTSASVVRAIENIAGTFRVTVSERSPGQSVRRGIGPGDPCEVSVGGERQIRGYVDTVRVAYDADSHTIDIGGRDATGDLVDCSAPPEPGEWHDEGPLRIVSDICAPFGVSVTSRTFDRPFKRFRVEEGETAFEAIERACRMRGILPLADGGGGIVLGRPVRGRSAVALEHGANILAANAAQSWIGRHSEYRLLGQRPGDDFLSADAAAHVIASATDPGVDRHRPLTILGEQALDDVEAQDRVQWEAVVRAGRSRRVTVRVSGWREGAGGNAPLWAPGRLARLRDPWLGIDRDMLVASVEFAAGPDGTTTRLLLMPEASFEQEILPEPEEESGWWG